MKLFIASLFLLATFTQVLSYGHDRVRLSDVKSITLTRGERTTGRRSSPVSQLTCVGGSGGCRVEPETVLCTNMGFDGRDATWKCEADLPTAYRLGKVTVSCEGYDYPDDPYILAGSCGLEYALELTEDGRRQSQNNWNTGSHHNDYPQQQHYHSGGSQWSRSSSRSSFANFFWFIVFVVIAVLLFNACSNRRNINRGQREGIPDGRDNFGGNDGGGGPGYPGGGGGGGGGYGSSSFGGAGIPGMGMGGARGGGGPGFWGGMMGGGLLGYMFGSRNRGHGYGYQQPGLFGGYQQPGMFGGGGYARPAPSFGGGFSGFGGGGGGSSSGSSHSSSYGGTRRR